MYWIFGVKLVNLGDSCTVGGDPAMNIIIARVPVLNVSEWDSKKACRYRGQGSHMRLYTKCA